MLWLVQDLRLTLGNVSYIMRYQEHLFCWILCTMRWEAMIYSIFSVFRFALGNGSLAIHLSTNQIPDPNWVELEKLESQKTNKTRYYWRLTALEQSRILESTYLERKTETCRCHPRVYRPSLHWVIVVRPLLIWWRGADCHWLCHGLEHTKRFEYKTKLRWDL